jgi:Ner family transcriptional regulator
MPCDWHPEKIKAEIRMQGSTLRALSRTKGFSRGAATVTLLRPWPQMEAAISAFLGVPAASIWPSRYDETGNPLPGLYSAMAKRSRRAARNNSQKRKAA